MKLIPDTEVLADQVQQVLFHVAFILQITLSNLKFIPDVLVPCLALTEKNALFSHFCFSLPCFMYGNVFLSCTLNNVFYVAIDNILHFNFLFTKKMHKWAKNQYYVFTSMGQLFKGKLVCFSRSLQKLIICWS